MNDEKFHELYKADVYYQPTITDIRCRVCGTRLKVYYAGNGLFAVKCGYCESITLVKAGNSTEATRYVGEYADKSYERNQYI